MTPFPLKIVTPDGLVYDGPAEELVVRTTAGDMGGLAGHESGGAALGRGRAGVMVEGRGGSAACIGGMLSGMEGHVTLVPTTFEWADQIDLARAERSYDRAQAVLKNKTAPEQDIRVAEARLKRALVRKSVAGNK